MGMDTDFNIAAFRKYLEGEGLAASTVTLYGAMVNALLRASAVDRWQVSEHALSTYAQQMKHSYRKQLAAAWSSYRRFASDQGHALPSFPNGDALAPPPSELESALGFISLPVPILLGISWCHVVWRGDGVVAYYEPVRLRLTPTSEADTLCWLILWRCALQEQRVRLDDIKIMQVEKVRSAVTPEARTRVVAPHLGPRVAKLRRDADGGKLPMLWYNPVAVKAEWPLPVSEVVEAAPPPTPTLTPEVSTEVERRVAILKQRDLARGRMVDEGAMAYYRDTVTQEIALEQQLREEAAAPRSYHPPKAPT